MSLPLGWVSTSFPHATGNAYRPFPPLSDPLPCPFLVSPSQAWNVLALDGSNWQKIDLFNFQTDIEVSPVFLMVKVIKWTVMYSLHV